MGTCCWTVDVARDPGSTHSQPPPMLPVPLMSADLAGVNRRGGRGKRPPYPQPLLHPLQASCRRRVICTARELLAPAVFLPFRLSSPAWLGAADHAAAIALYTILGWVPASPDLTRGWQVLWLLLLLLSFCLVGATAQGWRGCAGPARVRRCWRRSPTGTAVSLPFWALGGPSCSHSLCVALP